MKDKPDLNTSLDRSKLTGLTRKCTPVCANTRKICVARQQWRIQKCWKGVEDNLSAPSSFIVNAHKEIYAFTLKKRLFGKNISQ